MLVYFLASFPANHAPWHLRLLILFAQLRSTFPGLADWAVRLVVLGGVLSLTHSAPPLVPKAQAQAPPRPFSEVALYAGGSLQTASRSLHDFFHASPGFDVAASTPFYAGVAGLDVSLRRYTARPDEAQENFWAVPVTLRWGLRLPARTRLRAEGAARLGTLFMHFSSGSPGQRVESELLMGVDAGLALRFARAWSVVAGMRYEHVLTSTRIHVWHVRVGIRRRFDAPSWLQTLLR